MAPLNCGDEVAVHSTDRKKTGGEIATAAMQRKWGMAAATAWGVVMAMAMAKWALTGSQK